MKLIQYPQQQCGADIENTILVLENTAWPQSDKNEKFPSAPNTHFTSLVLLEKKKAICHVGIRKSVLLHKGQTYSAYGLSEVVTHPDYRGLGIASQMIKKAAEYIIRQSPDISVFTCEQNKVDFYRRGGWEAIKGTCFVGGTKEKPFRSDSLNLVTMMMFLSAKGKAHKIEFENTDLIFDLGENQLW